MYYDVTLPLTRDMMAEAGKEQEIVLKGHMGTHFDVMNKEFPLSYCVLPRRSVRCHIGPGGPGDHSRGYRHLSSEKGMFRRILFRFQRESAVRFPRVSQGDFLFFSRLSILV